MSAVVGSPLWDKAVALVSQHQTESQTWPTGDDAALLLIIVIELGNTTKMSSAAILAEIDRRVQERTAS